MWDEELERARYVSLATFKRNGDEVRLPIWFAPDPDEAGLLWMYTNRSSFKVKRLRRDSRARVAACDVRGNVHGAWFDARGIVHDEEGSEEFERGLAVVQARYGWQMSAVVLASRIGGRYRDRCALAIRLAAS